MLPPGFSIELSIFLCSMFPGFGHRKICVRRPGCRPSGLKHLGSRKCLRAQAGFLRLNLCCWRKTKPDPSRPAASSWTSVGNFFPSSLLSFVGESLILVFSYVGLRIRLWTRGMLHQNRCFHGFASSIFFQEAPLALPLLSPVSLAGSPFF